MGHVEASSHICRSCIFVLNIVFVEEENTLFSILQNRILHFICSKEMKIKICIYNSRILLKLYRLVVFFYKIKSFKYWKKKTETLAPIWY